MRIPVLVLASFLLFSPLCHALDQARVENGVDRAVQAFGVSGSGVIVAILDRGIDYTHPDFRNADGTTRIDSIFDALDDAGAANPYGVGTIYTRQQINTALAGGPPLAHRDATGHGVASAGIAAGNGRGNPLYRGMAPEATLIIVKAVTEGAAAHGDQPAEPAAPFSIDRVMKGIDFVLDRARVLGMPVVMLANFGSQGGPTDGTSQISRKIDSATGPGVIFVTGTGDDGGKPNRVGGTVAPGAEAVITFQKMTTGSLDIQLWYDATGRFDVTIDTPSGSFGPYASPEAENARTEISNAALQYFDNGRDADFVFAANQKRQIFLRLLSGTGNFAVRLRSKSGSGVRFDGTMNPSNIFSATENFFTSFVAPGSIWDGATALSNIAPNSYVGRSTWRDIDGIQRSITGTGEIGELWLGSSVGPTFDGRRGVDVAAPGDLVIAPSGQNSIRRTFRFNNVQNGNFLYAVQNAVSGAAPQVTGVIALMLEVDPTLTPEEVRSALHQSARRDSFTGATPNPMWGFGKMEAFGAITIVKNNLPPRKVRSRRH